MSIELPVPMANGATHVFVELVNYAQGYIVCDFGNAEGPFSNTRTSKTIPGLMLDQQAGNVIANAMVDISPETEIEPEPEPTAPEPDPEPEQNPEPEPEES